MFSQKKKDLEEYEPPQKSNEDTIDFRGIIVNGLQMGLSRSEVEHLRFGEYVDMFDHYKVIFNMRADGMKYKLPEKRVSMLDL